MRFIPIILSLGLIVACEHDINITVPPSPTPEVKEEPRNTIEFRVSGNANLVRIRYTTALDGTNQLTSSLPFFASFDTTRTSMFLSLDVTPLDYPLIITQPFTVAQIHANGNLFREAASVNFSATLSVSGTWRK